MMIEDFDAFLKEVASMNEEEYQALQKEVENSKCKPELESSKRILLGCMEAVRKSK